MPILCETCIHLVAPAVDRSTGGLLCPDCNASMSHKRLPLFIVTGASGCGKTTAIPHIRPLLPNWDVFDGDSLAWSGKQAVDLDTWLVLAHQIAQSGRPTLLCGYALPSEVQKCPSVSLFLAFHYLFVTCDSEIQEARLRARPAAYRFDDTLIGQHRQLNEWVRANFKDHSVDTTTAAPDAVGRRIARWAEHHWATYQSSPAPTPTGQVSGTETAEATLQRLSQRHPATEAPSPQPSHGGGGRATLVAPTARTAVRGGAKIDPTWRQWIAEALLIGTLPADILRVLTERGCDPAECQREVEYCRAHPYLRAASRRKNGVAVDPAAARLRAQDRLAAELARLDPDAARLERRKTITRKAFLKEFYARNVPVLLTGLMTGWRAAERWNPAYLKEVCGNFQVKLQPPPFSMTAPTYMPWHDYVDKMTAGKPDPRCYMYSTSVELSYDRPGKLLNDIVMPGEILDVDAVTHHQVQMLYGPAGTISPLHQDNRSTILCQVVGQKRVLLIPPYEGEYVYDQGTYFSPVDPDHVDEEKFPLFRKATIREVVLQPGEMVFLPVGWWHHVVALETCINVSFENFIYPNPRYSW